MDTLAQACVIYCLCGYLVCSVGKRTKCEPCMRDVHAVWNRYLEAYLLFERELEKGSLKRPSCRMLLTLGNVEGKIASALKAEDLCGDMMWNLLDALEECAIVRWGVTTARVFTAYLFLYYVILHLHFSA
uniref:Uncharacterized protein n=2 Tax=Ixodes ricinus TaxID=34613 RepID=V5H3A7_IXORI